MLIFLKTGMGCILFDMLWSNSSHLNGAYQSTQQNERLLFVLISRWARGRRWDPCRRTLEAFCTNASLKHTADAFPASTVNEWNQRINVELLHIYQLATSLNKCLLELGQWLCPLIPGLDAAAKNNMGVDLLDLKDCHGYFLSRFTVLQVWFL